MGSSLSWRLGFRGFGGLEVWGFRGLGFTRTPQVPFNTALMVLNSGYLGYFRGLAGVGRV